MRNNFTRNDFNEKRSVRQYGIESREIGNGVFAHREYGKIAAEVARWQAVREKAGIEQQQ